MDVVLYMFCPMVLCCFDILQEREQKNIGILLYNFWAQFQRSLKFVESFSGHKELYFTLTGLSRDWNTLDSRSFGKYLRVFCDFEQIFFRNVSKIFFHSLRLIAIKKVLFVIRRLNHETNKIFPFLLLNNS